MLDLAPSRYMNFFSEYLLWENKAPLMNDVYKMEMKITPKDISKLANNIFIEKNALIFYSY